MINFSNQDKRELISIIVPVYNIEKYLDKCIDSIVNQTYQNLEIILIDDGSTDNSWKKCDEWAEKDKRIKVIHKENGGVSSARNVGLEIAKGKYIGFVDSDDYIEKSMYEIMYKEIKKSNIDLVICDYQRVSFENKAENDLVSEYSVEVFDKLRMLQNFYPYFGVVWSCLFVKEKLENIKFDEDMYVGEDLKFDCSYILRCQKGIFVKGKLYDYRLRNDSVTRINDSKEKRLNYYINSIDAIKDTELMIVQNCNEKDIIWNIKKSTVNAYWTYIYGILSENLTVNNELKRKYCNELKLYNQYFSLKDKMFMLSLGISPKLFKIIYKNMKRIKNLLNRKIRKED